MTARSANRKPDAERVEGDRYYTPDAVADALVGLLDVRGAMCMEPHVGGGAFARALRKHGARRVHGFDVDPNATGREDCESSNTLDFLACPYLHPSPDWIVGNPPYRDAEAHIRHALAVTGRHVAFLLRLAILESAQRAPLWAAHPPRRVWVLSERPSFSVDGKTDSAAYAWVWWDRQYRGEPTLGWVSWRGAR